MSFQTKMESAMSTLQNGVFDKDPTVIGILVAVVVVFFTIVLLLLRKGSTKRRGVLLVGLCDTGKTLLYTRLVEDRFVTTHTSFRENIGSYVPKGGKGSLSIIDMPGHERLRVQFLENYKNSARALIFVVDSMTFQREIKEVAELLYSILSDKIIHQICPKVLLFCNKQDATFSKGASVIRSQLEKEMNTVRLTQSGALDSVDSTNSNNIHLGHRDRNFSFDDLKYDLDFLEGSARGNTKDGENPQLDEVYAWLLDIA